MRKPRKPFLTVSVRSDKHLPEFGVLMVGCLGSKVDWSLAQGAVEVYTPIPAEMVTQLVKGLRMSGFDPQDLTL